MLASPRACTPVTGTSRLPSCIVPGDRYTRRGPCRTYVHTVGSYRTNLYVPYTTVH